LPTTGWISLTLSEKTPILRKISISNSQHSNPMSKEGSLATLHATICESRTDRLNSHLGHWIFVAIPFGHCFRFAQACLRFAPAVGCWIFHSVSRCYGILYLVRIGSGLHVQTHSYAQTFTTVRPMSAGDSTTWMPHSAISFFLAAADSSAPDTIAPACPMRRPGGAV